MWRIFFSLFSMHMVIDTQRLGRKRKSVTDIAKSDLKLRRLKDHSKSGTAQHAQEDEDKDEVCEDEVIDDFPRVVARSG